MASIIDQMTDAHCDCLDNVIGSMPDLNKCLEICRRAKLPMPEMEQEAKNQYETASILRRELFPNRP